MKRMTKFIISKCLTKRKVLLAVSWVSALRSNPETIFKIFNSNSFFWLKKKNQDFSDSLRHFLRHTVTSVIAFLWPWLICCMTPFGIFAVYVNILHTAENELQQISQGHEKGDNGGYGGTQNVTQNEISGQIHIVWKDHISPIHSFDSMSEKVLTPHKQCPCKNDVCSWCPCKNDVCEQLPCKNDVYKCDVHARTMYTDGVHVRTMYVDGVHVRMRYVRVSMQERCMWWK